MQVKLLLTKLCLFFYKYLQRASQAEMIVQLAPSVKHQASAMLSILVRYNWHQFAIVTSQVGIQKVKKLLTWQMTRTKQNRTKQTMLIILFVV